MTPCNLHLVCLVMIFNCWICVMQNKQTNKKKKRVVEEVGYNSSPAFNI